MLVCIDPGHGGRYSGAIGSAGVPEKDIALSVALQMAGYLTQFPDDEVRLTRYTDMEYDDINLSMDLQARCDVANNWLADVFVSIHCNSFAAPSANGFEVWTNQLHDPADRLASMMWESFRVTFPEMRGRVDLSDNDPDKESRFWVLTHTDMPAVLFELAFISNPEDEKRLLAPAWQRAAAMSLVVALRRWAS